MVIKNKISEGMPVWKTCAGMVILAKEIINEKTSHLGVMNISVRRNGYGSIVAVEQDNLLATSFHPELTNDLYFHKYFVKKL